LAFYFELDLAPMRRIVNIEIRGGGGQLSLVCEYKVRMRFILKTLVAPPLLSVYVKVPPLFLTTIRRNTADDNDDDDDDDDDDDRRRRTKTYDERKRDERLRTTTHDGGRTTTTDDNKRQRTNYDDDTTDESNLKNPNPNHQKVSAFLGPRDATVIKPFQLASASEELVRN
jgi:hypothetical protein